MFGRIREGMHKVNVSTALDIALAQLLPPGSFRGDPSQEATKMVEELWEVAEEAMKMKPHKVSSIMYALAWRLSNPNYIHDENLPALHDVLVGLLMGVEAHRSSYNLKEIDHDIIAQCRDVAGRF